HARAPQQAEGNQTTQQSASIGSANEFAANWPAPLGRKQSGRSSHGDDPEGYVGRHCAGVGNNSAEARGRRSPFVGAASSGPMVWIRRCSCRGYPTRWPLVGVAVLARSDVVRKLKRTAFGGDDRPRMLSQTRYTQY